MTTPHVSGSPDSGEALGRHTVDRGYWSGISSRWNRIGSPLRPGKQDEHFFETAIFLAKALRQTPRLVILGVTPELYDLAQSHRVTTTAVDRTQSMIDVIWPGPAEAAYLGEWTDLPFAGSSFEIAFCDGGPIVVPYPEGMRSLVRELHRVLAPGGLAAIRTFVQPTQRESVDVVLRDLLAGAIPNTNVLKLRLGMAIQSNTLAGVQVSAIWEALHQIAPDLKALARQLGWVPDELLAIDAYRDCDDRYHFHTLNEFAKVFVEEPGGFAVTSIHVPAYPLGNCCPTFVFRRDDVIDGTSPNEICAAPVRRPRFLS